MLVSKWESCSLSRAVLACERSWLTRVMRRLAFCGKCVSGRGMGSTHARVMNRVSRRGPQHMRFSQRSIITGSAAQGGLTCEASLAT
jgi:hypothetical protein